MVGLLKDIRLKTTVDEVAGMIENERLQKILPRLRFRKHRLIYARRETPVRNPKVAANVQMMYEKWYAARALRLNEEGLY